MNEPSQIFDRIRRQRAHALRPRGSQLPPVPAPTPAPAMEASPAPADPAAQPPVRPAGGHALFSQVMRSHDRMGTRHL